MRVSLNWLADYVDVTIAPDDLAHRLNMAGLEVGEIERIGADWDEQLMTVGEVVSVDAHPNADRLRLATVALGGDERMTVVCGAPNVVVGQKIAFARAGAKLIDSRSGEIAVLKPAKIRGVESAGMVCSERELGLSDEHEGILELPADAQAGTPLAQLLGDTILDLDLTPNRPDWLSMVGIAREVAAIIGVNVREPDHTYEALDAPASDSAEVEIEDADLCSRYVATIVEGVRIETSPQWLQDRLRASGMRPINTVVDITNYVMLEMGQPLHAFDFAKIRGGKIVVRPARPNERLVTLDGIDRALTEETLMICDGEGPIAIAGVMGGLESEVTDETQTILIESATFHPASIRRTSARLKNRTEASLRFEKGLSAELAMVASQRATKLLVEIAGGRALHGCVDAYPQPQREVHIDVTRSRLLRVLGIDLPTSEVRTTLTSLGFGCHWEPPEHYQVRVPYWRMDVRIPDDVAEEVARIIGYDKIPTKSLGGDVPPAVHQPLRELRERMRDLLAAAGMQEVITYSLTTLTALEQVVSPEELEAHPPLQAPSAVSSEHQYLRPSLRAEVLQTLGGNIRQNTGELALFEAARVYLTQSEKQPEEQEHIVGVVAGQREDRWGRPSGESVDFYDAKGYLEAVLRAVGVEGILRNANVFGLVPGRTAEIVIEGETVGVIGQVQPSVAKVFDIGEDVYLFELVLDRLLPVLKSSTEYEAVLRYPPVVQDIALVVDREISADDLRLAIQDHDLVREVQVFDVYDGEGVPEGKKSVAFSIRYQSPEATLTDRKAAKAQEAILQRLRRDFGAVLRGSLES